MLRNNATKRGKYMNSQTITKNDQAEHTIEQIMQEIDLLKAFSKYCIEKSKASHSGNTYSLGYYISKTSYEIKNPVYEKYKVSSIAGYKNIINTQKTDLKLKLYNPREKDHIGSLKLIDLTTNQTLCWITVNGEKYSINSKKDLQRLNVVESVESSSVPITIPPSPRLIIEKNPPPTESSFPENANTFFYPNNKRSRNPDVVPSKKQKKDNPNLQKNEMQKTDIKFILN